MTRPQALTRRDLAYAMLLLALAALYFAPLLFGGLVPHGRDHGELNLPLQAWMHGRYAQGLPLTWMQSVACGEPVQDALITPEFYPPLALLLKLGSPFWAYKLHFALHFFWAALGCYFWARQRGASAEGALLAGLGGGFAGGMAFCLPWWTVLVSLAWLPWAFLGLELCLDGPRLRLGGAALLGLALGMAFSGGYPGMVVYALLPLSLRGAQGLWASTHRQAVLGAVALAALLSLLLALGPLAGVKRLAQGSLRGEALSVEAASENSMSPAALPQLLAPHALGRIADDSYLGVSWRFGSFDPHGLILYVGLAGLVLALVGLRARPERHGPSLFALAVIVLYALGDFTPLYEHVFLRMPVLDHLRAPMKAGVFAALLLCIPIADGYEQLRAHGARRPGRVLLWIGGLLLLGALLLWAAQGLLLEAGGRYVEQRIAGSAIHQRSVAHYLAKLVRWAGGLQRHLLVQGGLALLGGWLLLRVAQGGGRRAGLALGLVLFADLAMNGSAGYSKVSQSLYEQPPQSLQRLRALETKGGEPWRFLAWGRNAQLLAAFPEGRRDGDLAGERLNMELPPGNMASFFGFDQFNAYSVAQVGRAQVLYGWSRDDRAGADLKAQSQDLLSRRRLLDLGGVRYILSSVPLQAPGLWRADSGEPYLYKNLQALPLAYFATRCETVKDAAEAELRLRDPRDPASAWERPALLEAPGPWARAEGSVGWARYDDAEWDLSLEAPGAGTVVLARTFYAGLFRAEVDGVPAALVPANAGFSAVAVPAGAKRLRVYLDAQAQRRQRWPFWAGLLLCAALAAFAYARSRRPHA